ncbi:MAG: TatD family nuclease-associated radical SAM protein [bacterium]
MNSIAYPIKDALYLNITNRCTNECQFCIRNKTRKFDGQHELWLDKEPSVKEILAAIGDPTKYKQIVFCGYGEPLLRLDVVKQVAKKLKAQGARVVIDTNGHANLHWGRNILPELKGLVDMISISLDAENAKVYEKICQPAYGPAAYPAVIEFIKEAKKHIPEVEASIVDLPMVDHAACRKIAKELAVGFRVRSYYEERYVK